MTKLTWDQTGARLYETGVDHGVLFIPDNTGKYTNGVAWNGLTTVTESPSGAEANALYADNIKYLNLISAEEFGATLEAYTYPPEFMQFDGVVSPSAGVSVGQQNRKSFGLCYRTRIGNDLEGSDYGYKLHLIYNATAAPSEKAYATINDSPEAITFSWELTTTPVNAGDDLKPTAQITIDSTLVDPAALASLETMLYGGVGVDPKMPTPEEVIAYFDTPPTIVTTVTPTFNAGTGIVTIPTVVGVTYFIDGEVAAPGASDPLDDGSHVVTATANAGYQLSADSDDDWVFIVS